MSYPVERLEPNVSRMVRRIVTTAIIGALLAVPAAALGALDGVVGDPLDQSTSIDGTPQSSDIEQLRASYDPAGSLSVAVRFYAPLPDSGSTNLTVNISSTGSAFGCTPYGSSGATFDTVLAKTPMYDFETRGAVTGFTDAPPVTRSVSADGREITMSMSHPVLANQPYACFSAQTWFASSTYRFDPGCNCVTRIYNLDKTDVGWFPGRQPSAPVTPTTPAPTTKPRDARCPRWARLITSTTAQMKKAQTAARRAPGTKAAKAARARLAKLATTRATYQKAVRKHCRA